MFTLSILLKYLGENHVRYENHLDYFAHFPWQEGYSAVGTRIGLTRVGSMGHGHEGFEKDAKRRMREAVEHRKTDYDDSLVDSMNLYKIYFPAHMNRLHSVSYEVKKWPKSVGK